jgi:tetratricopeptide (TPR) repeat protein
MWGEHDISVKTLQEFYEMNLHDSSLVNKIYSKKQIVAYFRQYVQLLFDDKRFPEAERVCRTVKQFDPYDGRNLYQLAQVFLKEEQYDSAIAICSFLIKEIPNISPPYMLLAELYMCKGNYAKSISVLENCFNVIRDTKEQEKVRVELECLRNSKQKDK